MQSGQRCQKSINQIDDLISSWPCQINKKESGHYYSRTINKRDSQEPSQKLAKWFQQCFQKPQGESTNNGYQYKHGADEKARQKGIFTSQFKIIHGQSGLNNKLTPEGDKCHWYEARPGLE